MQKYLIKLLPIDNFCFSIPKTIPTFSSDNGSPNVAA